MSVVLREYAAQKVLAFVLVVGLACVVYIGWLYWTVWERSCCGRSPKVCRCCFVCRKNPCADDCLRRR